MPDYRFNPDEDELNRKADPEGHRLWRFKHYRNEMTASETGLDPVDDAGMPWEYQHNVARHLWTDPHISSARRASSSSASRS